MKNISLDGYYDSFNNCREQGYVLQLYDRGDTGLNIWACQSRNSNDIMIVTGNNDDIDNKKMFSDSAFEKAKYFSCENYDSAVDYTMKKIKVTFPMDTITKASFKFDTHRSLDDIRRIEMDAEEFDYEDYHDLATFEDINEKYFCDLIIDSGKVCLRYSKKYDENDFDNLSLEEFKPDLTNEVTLMLGMQERLSKFVMEELEHDLQMDKNISI